MLGIAMVAGSGLVALAPASPAQAAELGCQSGGVYRLWVRGSGQALGGTDAQAFRSHVSVALNNAMPGGKSDWAELGDLDGNSTIDDPNLEYPAVPVPWTVPTGEYGRSVRIGTDELVKHLNQRYGSGPGDRNCSTEAVVLGGFSQGADVIGWALERTGYGALSQQAKNHIEYVALYGDPKYNRNCGIDRWWKRGNWASSCHYAGGILTARAPYTPDSFRGRLGSWCDQDDGVCTGKNMTMIYGVFEGNHNSVYRGFWIWQSAAEIANGAKAKVLELNPPNISVGSMTFLGTDLLTSGRRMYPNQYILSRDARFVLTLQGDGNLVLYGPGFQPIWSTGTGGRSVDSLIVQPDGNVVLYGTGTQGAIWQTGTVGQGDVSLKVQEDGNVVLYRPGAVAVWQTQTVRSVTGGTFDGTDTLLAGQWLKPMHYLRSADKRYVLFMQGDGNLVLWAPGQRILWSTGTGGRPVVDGLVLQGDGNLVLYAQGRIWYNSKAGSGSNQLKVQGDGNVVTYSNNGATWWTGTAGRI